MGKKWIPVSTFAVVLAVLSCRGQDKTETAGWEILGERNLLARPKDGVLEGDTLFLLERTNHLEIFGIHGHDLEVASSVDLSGLSIQSPTCVIRTEGNTLLWEAETGTLYTIRGGKVVETRRVVEPLPDFWSGSDPIDLTPRGHSCIGVLGSHFIIEAREYLPQSQSLSTEAHLLEVSPFQSAIDTIRTFGAASYARKKGQVFSCCGRAPVFAQHLQWTSDAQFGLAAVDQTHSELDFWPTVDHEIPPIPIPFREAEVSLKKMRNYSSRIARSANPEWNWIQRLRYRMLLFRSPGRVMAEYSQHGPIVTQILFDSIGRIWLRAFDPDVWPFGLSSEFLIVNPKTRAISYSSFPAGIMILDINQDRALCLKFGDRGSAKLLVLQISEGLGSRGD